MITRMIPRRRAHLVRRRLDAFPAVGLIGPRQAGKTTLALEIARSRDSVYLDLESPADRAKLTDAELYLDAHQGRLVVLDEVQRMPELFQTLRGAIDRARARGEGVGRYLLLGSASRDLLRQSGESLAGRIAYVELTPLDVLEVGDSELENLWVRGGFANSFLAPDDESSAVWREEFIRTYLERDIPQLAPRIPAETLRRLWTMLAHVQGAPLNAAQLARGLGVDGKTVARHLDLLVDLLLVRRLEPYLANVGKRLIRSPKVYLRDSGILHALLGLDDREAVLGHPVAGASWEGYVLENLIAAAPERSRASFFRTQAGAEIDLWLQVPKRGTFAIEVKRSLAPKLEKGFLLAQQDLQPDSAFVVYPGEERYPLRHGVEAIGVRELAATLAAGA
jgi:uncharacterized protein